MVIRDSPFHRTVDDETKFAPVTVNMKAAPPAEAEAGFNVTMLGAGLAFVGGGFDPPPPAPEPPHEANNVKVTREARAKNRLWRAFNSLQWGTDILAQKQRNRNTVSSCFSEVLKAFREKRFAFGFILPTLGEKNWGTFRLSPGFPRFPGFLPRFPRPKTGSQLVLAFPARAAFLRKFKTVRLP